MLLPHLTPLTPSVSSATHLLHVAILKSSINVALGLDNLGGAWAHIALSSLSTLGVFPVSVSWLQLLASTLFPTGPSVYTQAKEWLPPAWLSHWSLKGAFPVPVTLGSNTGPESFIMRDNEQSWAFSDVISLIWTNKFNRQVGMLGETGRHFSKCRVCFNFSSIKSLNACIDLIIMASDDLWKPILFSFF